MIINRPAEVSNSSQKLKIIKSRAVATPDLLNYFADFNNIQKHKSMSLLDAKKLKSKLSQVLKDDLSRKNDSSFLDNQKPKKPKNVREYFHRTFMKKRDRMIEKPLQVQRQKMEIIGIQDLKTKSQHSQSFKIKEIKMRRKGSPYFQSSPTNNLFKIDQKHEDRYYKVLSMAKTRFSNERFFNRKPFLPEEHKFQPNKTMSNNFVKLRQPKHKLRGQSIQRFEEMLEPWQKNQEFEQQIFDIQ